MEWLNVFTQSGLDIQVEELVKSKDLFEPVTNTICKQKGKKEEIQYYYPIMKRSFGSVIGSWCQWFHLWIITCDVDGWPFLEWQL